MKKTTRKNLRISCGSLTLIGLLAMSSGCAAIGESARNHTEPLQANRVADVKVAIAVFSPRPSSANQGEAVHNPTLAYYLADLALAEDGIDTLGRKYKISFFEGIYTITFLKPSDQATSCDYVVDISEDNSDVLRMVTRPIEDAEDTSHGRLISAR